MIEINVVNGNYYIRKISRPDFPVYLYKDGSWHGSCWESDNKNGHYKTKEEAESVLNRFCPNNSLDKVFEEFKLAFPDGLSHLILYADGSCLVESPHICARTNLDEAYKLLKAYNVKKGTFIELWNIVKLGDKLRSKVSGCVYTVIEESASGNKVLLDHQNHRSYTHSELFNEFLSWTEQCEFLKQESV
jgi:hypothetical protein